MQMAIVGKYKLLIAALSGELDHHRAAQIREDIDRELMRKGVAVAAYTPGIGGIGDLRRQ